MLKSLSKLKFNIFQVIGIFLVFKLINENKQWCSKESTNAENQNYIQTDDKKTTSVKDEQDLLIIHLLQSTHDALSLKENCQN